MGSVIKPIIAASLRQDGIKHGFFTREGGVSAGVYQSLNCGFSSQDKAANIAENRRRAAAWLAPAGDARAAPVLTPYQHHSDTVITVETPWQNEAPKGDAVVTKLANCPIGILTADCGAVLFADEQARIIGAAHAGWKGALAGILQNTIDAMLALGAKAENIRAVSGPSISPQNYEVGAEFRQTFLDKDPDYSRYFMPWTGESRNIAAADGTAPTYHCDLWRFIHDRLAEKGVQTESLHICTYADAARFFSFRRATHEAQADYGRQLSAIMLTAS